MNKTFENICKMSQLRLKKHTEDMLRKTHSDITVGDGFVFAKGTFPVLLVAHLDTVHDLLPDLIVYDSEKDMMWSPNGIGGDDRCGVYMILEIVKKYNCSVLFCEEEERGGIGANKFIETDLAKELVSQFNYAIELDRRGHKDAVFYDCDNSDFEDFITKRFYDTAYGSFSDICVVAPFLKCAAVNLSCGYYNAHTNDEYVKLKEMDKSIEEVCKILDRTTEKDKFEYIEAKYGSYYSRYYDGYYYGSYYKKGNDAKKENDTSKGSSCYSYGWYDEDNEDVYSNYYVIEYYDENGKTDWFDTYATSEAEAVGRFLMWNPELCYNNITDIMVESFYK